jgi:hypothetical protein
MKLELSLWWKNKDFVRFGVSSSVTGKISAFWNVTPCILVARCHFGGTLLRSSSGYFSYIGWAVGIPETFEVPEIFLSQTNAAIAESCRIIAHHIRSFGAAE